MQLGRAPLVLSATVAGVAAGLSYQPQSPAAGRTAERPGIVASLSPGSPVNRAAPQAIAVVGADAPNQYGDVQVRVSVRGGRIVSIEPVTLPGGDPRSQEISAVAAPILGRQAVAAQSARIDGVSGASYTSDGYRQSLQSAIDQLGNRLQTAGAA